MTRASQVSFIDDSFEGFPPVTVNKSSQTSGGVSDHHVASQFPEPHNKALFPFNSRISNWVEGLVKMGLHRDVAELSTKRDKPSTLRQFESGWKQAEAYFKRHNYKFEDITAVAFANFLGRQFLDEGLATSTVINHFYACAKPAWFKFNIKLKESEFLADIILSMKKERPGS